MSLEKEESVKGIKILGLAALAVLALNAFAGIASASGPGYFQSYNLPTTINGTASGIKGTLSVGIAESCTSPSLTGTLTKATDSLATSASYPNGSCGGFLNMNGCEYIFHPPGEGTEGTFDIGGAECKGITGSGFGEFRIPAQNGLGASFQNMGSGSTATISVEAHATGLKYELKSEGKYGEIHSNGEYHTTWSLSGEHAGARAWIGVEPNPGLRVQEGSGAVKFHTAVFPVTVSATQISTTIEHTLYSRSTLQTSAGGLKCGNVMGAPLFSGSTTGELMSELQLTPLFPECYLGGLPATVATSVPGCRDTFGLVNAGPPFLGSLTLCEMKITKTGSKCVITVSGQTKNGMEYLNAGSGASSTVTAKANLSGIAYAVENGKECPTSTADGPYTNGTYIGGAQISVSKIG